MNNEEKFLLMQAQRSQLSVLKKEAEFEKANIYVIRLTDKEIALSEMGKNDSKSITLQINKWKETLSDAERDYNFSFVGLDDTFLDFKDYLLSKYKGAKKAEWEMKLNIPEYEQDVKRLFMSRIYEHKGIQSMQGKNLFVTGVAHNEYQLNESKKSSRNFSHEAVGNVVKVLNSKNISSPLSDEDKIWLAKLVQSVGNGKLINYLPDRNSDNNDLFLN